MTFCLRLAASTNKKIIKADMSSKKGRCDQKCRGDCEHEYPPGN